MANRTGARQIDARKVAGYGFVAGMVLAPFFALIYGWNAGLGVMAFALASTTYLAVDALRHADTAHHPRLRILVALNAALTLACIGVLAVRAL